MKRLISSQLTKFIKVLFALKEKATFESRIVKLKKSMQAEYEAYLLPHCPVPLHNHHHLLHPLEKQVNDFRNSELLRSI